MNGFDKRERAEEGKFALDQELRFKANARRNKLLGLWAAGLLGKTGEAAANYATEVVKSDFEAPGDEDVFRKVKGDLEKAASDAGLAEDPAVVEGLVERARALAERIGSETTRVMVVVQEALDLARAAAVEAEALRSVRNEVGSAGEKADEAVRPRSVPVSMSSTTTCSPPLPKSLVTNSPVSANRII